MLPRLFQLLFLSVICIVYSFGWGSLLNLEDHDTLRCYSCKGSGCEKTVLDNNDNAEKIVCNKKTQLCWAGLIDNQPYRTCASRHCTPTDFSLGSRIRIETCCRSNLCNSDLITPRKSHRRNSSFPLIQTSTQTITTSSVVNDEESQLAINRDLNSEVGDNQAAFQLNFKTSDPKSFDINWDRVPYNTAFSTRAASISAALLILMPSLLLIIF
ncbi:unnamed protein product [Rotaria magnacalcarata]|uniref:Uncharacterized protein n=1 Tax=Rotaria magnacalcarata TaxID=392030 RepID=A0A815X0N8_9BILA|nr:unnamed protein product [Rotaria magnacalcarata]CAF1664104.1 unnamed protein product [Rotaria magnacalcarata]CAF2015787.1 unnamed protein product [Rotaria magnacalcarata]CAF2059620.1 unnamed protein product [Rotaria magnacalcarata]CAF2103418.1 unnamed protein product [Rotaria magnacalcarata]